MVLYTVRTLHRLRLFFFLAILLFGQMIFVHADWAGSGKASADVACVCSV